MQKTLTDMQPAVPLYYVKYGLNYVVSDFNLLGTSIFCPILI